VLILGPIVIGRAGSTATNVVLVLLAGGMAVATTRIVEDPVRYSPRLAVSQRRTLAMAAGLSAVALVCTVVVARDADAPRDAPEAEAPFSLDVPPPTATPITQPPAMPTPTAATQPAPSTPATAAAPTTISAPTTTVDPAVAALAATTAVEQQAIAAAAATNYAPSNLTPSLSRAHSDAAKPFADGCFAGFADTRIRSCSYGAAGGATRVALFGDSHAAAWFPAVEASAVARGWALDVYSKATCPPLFADVWNPGSRRHYAECDAWRGAVLERLRADPPALVVLAANRAYGDAYRLATYGPEWLQGLAQMVSTLTQLGSRVVVLGPVPLPPNDVPLCLSAHPTEAAAWCAPSVDDRAPIDGVTAERDAVTAAGGMYVDVRPWFCAETGCVIIVGNLLVYRDQNHLTTGFAEWLAPVVGAELDVAMTLPSS
jgi:hypothetical protein